MLKKINVLFFSFLWTYLALNLFSVKVLAQEYRSLEMNFDLTQYWWIGLIACFTLLFFVLFVIIFSDNFEYAKNSDKSIQNQK